MFIMEYKINEWSGGRELPEIDLCLRTRLMSVMSRHEHISHEWG